jgi:hypothetical protein
MDVAPMETERRLAVLHELASTPVSESRTSLDACRAAMAVLQRAREDVRFALLHLFDADADELRLAASFGVDPRTVRESTVIPANDDVASWRVAEGLCGIRAVLGGGVTDTAVIVPVWERAARRPLGALTLGASPCRALDGDYRAFLEAIGRIVSRILIDARAFEGERRAAREHVANLERGLVSNRQVGQAVGILMHRHKLSDDESFELLRRTSQTLNRKLRDIADDVVLTGELPDDEPRLQAAAGRNGGLLPAK